MSVRIALSTSESKRTFGHVAQLIWHESLASIQRSDNVDRELLLLGVMKVMQVPVLPARPVRPAR